jgi:hypothetical protein
MVLVFSLCGVVLIARPVALFGGASGASDPGSIDGGNPFPVDTSEKGTPAERLVAVGLEFIFAMYFRTTHPFV